MQQVDEEGLPSEERTAAMDACNPLYVPRNYLMQEAIEAVAAGNYEPLHELHKVLKHPFVEQPGMQKYSQPAPHWAKKLAGVAVLS